MTQAHTSKLKLHQPPDKNLLAPPRKNMVWYYICITGYIVWGGCGGYCRGCRRRLLQRVLHEGVTLGVQGVLRGVCRMCRGRWCKGFRMGYCRACWSGIARDIQGVLQWVELKLLKLYPRECNNTVNGAFTFRLSGWVPTCPSRLCCYVCCVSCSSLARSLLVSNLNQ